MDIVTMSMDMVDRLTGPADERGRLADYPAHSRQRQSTEEEEHDTDAELHGEAEAWRDHDTEQNDCATDGQDR
jgi:hypothetical protein